MYNFFSLVSDGTGRPMYADYFGYKCAQEDTLNKYEYNPITRQFQIDQLNTTDDSEQIKQFCLNLDFKIIVPELVIKPVIHPFKDRNRKRVTKKDLELLKQWIKVGNSVENSIEYSILNSIENSIGNLILNSIGDTIWNLVGNLVWNSVKNSSVDSILESIWDSSWNSIYAYISSFFTLKKWVGIKHKKGQNPFQPAIDLWERGLVPSFDGTTWRLHSGPNATILWKGKI